MTWESCSEDRPRSSEGLSAAELYSPADGDARKRRQLKARCRRGRWSVPGFLMLLLCLGIGGPPLSSALEEMVPGGDIQPAAGAPMDFAQCVRLSLRQSPNLTKSSLEIDLRRLDEADARYAFIPSFSLRTLYYVNQPENDTARPYSIHFITETYNPVENYFSLQARMVLTQMGILAHLQVISDFLERLGMGFLEIETLDRMMALQREIQGIAEQGLAYARSRWDSGGVSGLDVQMAERELELARLEADKLESAKATILEGIAGMVGLGEKELVLNGEGARDRVLGPFDPVSVSLEEARRRSFELRIQSLKRELQEKNITLAYARFLPTFIWGVQTTDPFSVTDERGLFFSVGLELPIWDGLKRYHNVSRQKTVLRQVEAEGRSKELGFDGKWSAARRKLEQTEAGLKLARSQESLAELKERQTAIGYNAGRQPFNVLAADRKALLESRRNVLTQVLERDKAVLTIRNLSGDLVREYVDTTPY